LTLAADPLGALVGRFRQAHPGVTFAIFLVSKEIENVC